MSRNALLSALVLPCLALAAADARAAGPFILGSSNTANIEPEIPHPAETPCIVPLFNGATFGPDPVHFSYAPPAACGTAWARVVLQTKIGLNAGRQFDRTGSITLDGVSLWFGTTAEPRSTLGPQWTVQTDVTRDTALLRKAGAGRVIIGNYQSSVYTSTITASAELLFYPANASNPAPETPDLIIPLASDTDGDSALLGTSTPTLSTTLSLPTNVERAELDLTLQGQSQDEFWYSNVPDSLTGPLEEYGGGAFREGEVTLDGAAAGEAPVYPLIFTGGIDPYLWEPVPGVMTLDIKPFPVELSPFAATFSDGKPHVLSVSVANATSYFAVFGALYVTLDHGTKQITGGVTGNTLSGAPATTVTTTTGTTAAGATTHLVTKAADDFTISGTALTSHGPVVTTVHQTLGFANVQDFVIGSSVYDQTITEGTRTHTVVTRAGPAGLLKSDDERDYPISVAYDETIAADGSASQATTVKQNLSESGIDSLDGIPTRYRALSWMASPIDTLGISAAGAITGNSGQSTRSSYAGIDTSMGCYAATLAAASNALTKASSTTSCLAVLQSLSQ